MLSLPLRTTCHSRTYVRSFRATATSVGPASPSCYPSTLRADMTRKLSTASTAPVVHSDPGRHMNHYISSGRNKSTAHVRLASTKAHDCSVHHHHHHPTHSFDLPDLPSVPPYPCPFLTDEEIKTYLEPLYLRSWTVQPSDPEHSKTPAPELVKSFKFSSESAAREFLEDFVQWVETRENHHATKTVESSVVTIRVHTHSGLRPASHPEEPRKARVSPGITLRDIRFAYLLEATMYHEGKETPHTETAPEGQPRTAEAVEARRRQTQ